MYEEVKNLNKIVKVSFTVALIFAIASIGFANAKPKANATTLQIVRMSYAASNTQLLSLPPGTTWTALPGNQFPVAHLTLDGNPDTWYYLGVDSFKSRSEIPTGYVYLFFLTPPDDPAFYDWWAARGVTASATELWKQIMWAIISGEEYDLGTMLGGLQPLHMFGFVPSWPMGPRAGLPKLIDSLQYYLYMTTGHTAGSPMADLMLQGDYPTGTYEFTCKAAFSQSIPGPWDNYLDGVTMTMKIR